MKTKKHQALFQKYLKAETGVAAIEFACIFPIMLILYFGLIDLTSIISTHRKMTTTASTVADLVGQQSPITSTQIDDYFKAAELISSEFTPDALKINVEDYRNDSGAAVKQWDYSSTGGPACPAISNAGMTDLMTAGNDIIVAQVCMVYVPVLVKTTNWLTLDQASFNLDQQVMVRPRATTQIDCTGC
jgi:Flp pilus assembly protein TadG